MRNQKKAGILLSYLNIALNMCINVFFTPFLIRSLGQAEYGLYKVVQSFAGQLAIMTFGMSTLVARNIAYYDCRKEQKEKENFLAMALIISVVLSLLVVACGVVLYHTTGKIFANSFTVEEQLIAKRLLFLLTVNMGVLVLSDFFSGILGGHEQFALLNGSKTLRLVLRVSFLVVLLLLGLKSTAIVLMDLALNILVLLSYIFLGLAKLRERIHYYYFDKPLFRESLLFSGAILFQTVINQVNQNLDNVILGVMTNTKIVTLYSSALIIYTSFCGITAIISSVFTPKATRLISSGATSEELVDFVVLPGRYQLMIAGAIAGGFILFGKQFICLWLGAEFLPIYKITLILVLPMILPLILGATNSILDAKLKRMSRSLILLVMAGVNVVLSVLLIRKVGYIGAAYGTAISVIVGHIIIMNIYLQKWIHLDIIRMIKNIFSRLLPSIVVAVLICIPLQWIAFSNALLSFLVQITGFVAVYAVIVYFFGMNPSEKQFVKHFFRK